MGTVGQITIHSPPLSQVKSFKRIVEKRSLGGGTTLTWSPPLNDHSRDQGSGCSDEWVGVAERANHVSRLVHLIEREEIKSAEIIGANSLVQGSEWL